MKSLQNIKADLIHQISLLCSDGRFDDFRKEEYELALLRADKKIAIRYQILTRYTKFTNNIKIPPDKEGDTDWLQTQKATDIILEVYSFIEEHIVFVNSVIFTKDTSNELQTDLNRYQLYSASDGWHFNYSPRTESDAIEIHFSSDVNPEDYEADETSPIIPTKYEPERVNLSIYEIGKMGFAKYQETDARHGKYKRLMFSHPDKGFVPELRGDDGPKRIKILQYP